MCQVDIGDLPKLLYGLGVLLEDAPCCTDQVVDVFPSECDGVAPVTVVEIGPFSIASYRQPLP